MSAAPNGAVIVYKDSEYSGYNQTYQGPNVVSSLHSINWSGTSNNQSTDISSLAIGPNAWFLAFDGSGCSGDAILFSPNQQIPDLKQVARGSKDWDNEIKSFVIFGSDPSANLKGVGQVTFTQYPG